MVTFPHHARRRAHLMALAVALLAAACGGGGEPTPPARAAVATVTVTGFPATIYVGATLQLAVSTTDAGGAVLTGRTITYSSNNNSVASVSPSGVVTAMGVGSTVVHVLSEGKSADVAVNVALVPVAAVVVTPTTGRVSIGGTLQLSATTRDSTGTALTGRTVTWTSSAPQFATVSASGLVSGVADGSTVIRATSEGRFAEATITVSSAVAPTITSVTPAELTPGITATITGTNFSGVTTGNTVTIDGTSVVVTAASATQLTITVPVLACVPAHSARVQVITDGLAAVALQPVRVGTAVSIAANTPLLLTPAQAGCAELPTSTGRYLVSVVNLAKDPGLDQSATTGFRLSGSLPPASLASVQTTPTLLRQPVATQPVHASLPAGIDPFDARGTRTSSERMHEVVLESSRAAVTRLRASRASRPSLSSRSLIPEARRAVVPLPTVGDTRKFRVAQFTTTLNSQGSCSNYVEITARAVYIGTRAVIYEDVAAPLKNTMDDVYQNLGREFDSSMYVTDSTYFGDPLATDAGTDNDHHLNMVFTPSISPGIAGFVTGCDFFMRDSSSVPANDDRVSNFGEYFYAFVPTVAGTGFKGNTADSWLRGMRSTIVHEVKHIASFGARLSNNATVFEESWLEEGMARHAEELWQRNYIYNVAWKANTMYQESLYCDVRPTVAACTGKPYDMFGIFTTLYNVLDNPGASSMFGRTKNDDFNFYSETWSFVRYSLDRYATSESAFLRGITQSTSTSGLASISAQTGGRSPAELITNWSLAMYMDDLTANPDLSVPTWHMHDIFAGMNRDFSSSQNLFVKPYPLTPAEVSATFTADNAGIFNGSFAMYLVPANGSGTSTIQLSNVTGAGVGLLRVALVRLP